VAHIINGIAVSQDIKNELRAQIDVLKEQSINVCLATVLVGDDAASHSYVKSKIKNCEELGIISRHFGLLQETSQTDLLQLIDSLNSDKSVNGILVQLPLPSHINEDTVINAINADKDVDGFTPASTGRLLIGQEGFVPCTPAGIIELLKRNNINTIGAEVVVVGRSNIVGKPVANLLLRKGQGADATVTICHSRSKNIKEHTLRADILIAAIGKAKFITADMVKEDAVVIDVGVNRIGIAPSGKAILAGDVDYVEVTKKASYITPVPGGVGPMTIAMLMKNTVKAAQIQAGLI